MNTCGRHRPVFVMGILRASIFISSHLMAPRLSIKTVVCVCVCEISFSCTCCHISKLHAVNIQSDQLCLSVEANADGTSTRFRFKS